MLPIPFLGTSRVWYGVISADILIIISRLEEWNMQNKVWEQVGCFLNKLRCENVTRDTAVEVPGYRDTQQELEEMRETCEEIVRSLPEDQWHVKECVSTNGAWKEFTINLEYKTQEKPGDMHLIIVASASKYGDYFTGGDGSVLYPSAWGTRLPRAS